MNFATKLPLGAIAMATFAAASDLPAQGAGIPRTTVGTGPRCLRRWIELEQGHSASASQGTSRRGRAEPVEFT